GGIQVVDDPVESMRLRAQYGGGAPLVGHFGTYGDSIRGILEPAAAALLDASDCRVLLVGRGSHRVAREIVEQRPSLRNRVHGTDTLADDDVSRHVSACDVMLQPYPDGISTRRTSAMVALAHARPLVTTPAWPHAVTRSRSCIATRTPHRLPRPRPTGSSSSASPAASTRHSSRFGGGRPTSASRTTWTASKWSTAWPTSGRSSSSCTVTSG